MIVKHRRGTTKEWQEVDLIPEEGELVIEECIDGSIKCKIGTGYTKFSRLPYIDDQAKRELLNALEVVASDTHSKIVAVQEGLSADVANTAQELHQVISDARAELTENFINRDTDLKAYTDRRFDFATKTLREESAALEKSLTEKFDNAQASLKTDFESNLAEGADSLTATFNAALGTEEAAREKSDADLRQNILALEASVNDNVTSTATELSESFSAQVSALAESTNKSIAELDDRVTILEDEADTKFADAAKDFNTKLSTATTALTDDFIARDAVITTKFTKNIDDSVKMLREETASAIKSISMQSNGAQTSLKAEVKAEFDTSLAEAAKVLKSSFNTAMESEKNARIASDEDIRQNIQAVSSQVNERITSAAEDISKKVSTRIDDLSTKTEAAVSALDSKLTAISEDTTSRIASQAISFNNTLKNTTDGLAKAIERVDARVSSAAVEVNSQLGAQAKSFDEKLSKAKEATALEMEKLEAKVATNLAGLRTELGADVKVLDNKLSEAIDNNAQAIKGLDNKLSSTTADFNAQLYTYAKSVNNQLSTVSDATTAEVQRLDSELALAITDIGTVGAQVKVLDHKLSGITDNVNQNINAMDEKLSSAAAGIESKFAAHMKSFDEELSALRDNTAFDSEQLDARLSTITAGINALDTEVKVIDNRLSTVAEDTVQAVSAINKTITSTTANFETRLSAEETNVKKLCNTTDKITSKIEQLDSKLTSAAADIRAEQVAQAQVFDTKLANLADETAQALDSLDDKLANTTNEFNQQLNGQVKSFDEKLSKAVTKTDTALTSLRSQITTNAVTAKIDLDAQAKVFDNKVSSLADTTSQAIEDIEEQMTAISADFSQMLDAQGKSFDKRLTDANEKSELEISRLDDLITKNATDLRAELTEQAQIFDTQLFSQAKATGSEVTKLHTRITNVVVDFDAMLRTCATNLSSKITKVRDSAAELANRINATDARLDIAEDVLADNIDSIWLEIEAAKTAIKYLEKEFGSTGYSDLEQEMIKQLDALNSLLLGRIEDIEQLISESIEREINELQELTSNKFAEVEQSITAVTDKLFNDVQTELEVLNSEAEARDIATTARFEDLEKTVAEVSTQLSDEIKVNLEALNEEVEARDLVITGKIEALETDKATEARVTLVEDGLRGRIDFLSNDTQSRFEELETSVAEKADGTALGSVQELVQGNISKITALEADISQFKADTANNFDDEVEGSFAHKLAEKIQVESGRIDQLVAMPDDLPTNDTSDTLKAITKELTDIRVGYDGRTHLSASAAVRAIGDDLRDLEERLPSYIPANAIDGLHYENNMLYLTTNGEVLEDTGVSIVSGGGGGGGSSSTVTITATSARNFTVAEGREAKISFIFKSVENGAPTGDGTGDCTITVNGEAKSSITVYHEQEIPLDVAKYLVEGKNTIKVTCVDQNGTQKSITYNISLLKLRVELDPAFDKTKIFEDTVTVPYLVYGQDTTKYVNIEVDGSIWKSQELGSSVHEEGDTAIIENLTYGTHSIKIYLFANLEKDDGTVEYIESDAITFEVICKGASIPAFAEPLLVSNCNVKTITQGDSVSISSILYDPKKTGTEKDAEVTCTVYTHKANDLLEEYATKKMLVVSGQPFTWEPQGFPTGTVTFKVSYKPTDYGYEINELEKQHSLFVNELNLKVSHATNNLQLFLSASNKTNADTDFAEWTYNNITTTFENFNWKSNGWDPEEIGEHVLRLNGEAKAIINFAPFEKDAKNGKTLEFDFLVRDVNSRDAVVIDCTDNTGIGFKALSDRAYLRSRNTFISCAYKDNERIHVAVTVEPSNTSTCFVSIYLDGALAGVQSYSSTDSFIQDYAAPITLGSPNCGLDIYSLRVYNRALSADEVLKNYIAGINSAAIREQLVKDNYFGEPDKNGKISKYKVSYAEAKKLANIPIITFTGSMPKFKGDKKKNAVYFKFEDPTNTDPTQDDLCYYANANKGKGILLKEIDVQGTSSAGYARKNWKIKLDTKLRHIKDAAATNTFCIKVDYAEATGTHNTGTANYVETLYDKTILNKGSDNVIYGEGFIPPQKTDSKVRTTIQGFPCLIFERADENSEYVFSSKGNFNFDKGSKEAFGFTSKFDKLFEPESWEFCNNTSGACNFLTELPADWREDFEPRYTSKTTTVVNNKGQEEEVNAWDRIEDLRDIETAQGSSLTEAQKEELEELHNSTIADFKIVHDWVVSTATKEPILELDENGNEIVVGSRDIDFTNKPDFDNPIKIGNVEFYKDSKEYRLAKFKNEFENYFNLHYTLIYYVFTFFALMVDQRAKNLFLTRWKDDTAEDGTPLYHWYPYFYDNDTIFGINNVGALTFDYYHEDSGEFGQHGTMNVYNGQNSVLWNNFRESFAFEIQETYQELRNNGKLTYDKLTECYIANGSDKWSAAVYNEDAEYKYLSMARPHLNDKGVMVSDKTNLGQVRGPAEHHLRYFLDSRLKYCDSKWYAGDYPKTNNMITLRLNPIIPVEVTEDDRLTEEEMADLNLRSLNVTPYSTMYAGVKFKSGTLRQELIKAGDTHSFSFTEYSNDTETYLYGADELTSIGSIAHYRCSYIDLAAATKLIELKIGHRASNYDNPNLGGIEVGTKRLLKMIDLRNCSGLGQKEVNGKKQLDLNLADCPNIEHIYTEGTNLSSVTLPNGGFVKTLHLPASTETISIKNQLYLQDQNFYVAAYNKIAQLEIENCPGIDSRELLDRCLKAIATGENRRSLRVYLTGITPDKWSFENADFIKSLFPKKENGSLVGGITSITSNDDATLSGTCYIANLSGEDYADIKKHYPALNIEFGTMTSIVTFKYTDEDGVPYEQSVPVEGKNSAYGTCSVPEFAIMPAIKANKAFTYSLFGWSTEEQEILKAQDVENLDRDGLRAHEEDYLRYKDAQSGSSLASIAGNRTVYPVFKATRNEYKVTFINPTDNNKVIKTVMVPYYSSVKVEDLPSPDPIKMDSRYPELYAFNSWSPAPTEIKAHTNCYAQFVVLDDQWYTLGINDISSTSFNSTAGTMSFNSCDNRLNSVVRIPEEFTIGNTYKVIGVGGFASYKYDANLGYVDLELVRFPETLQEIFNNGFKDCTSLTEVTLPETLKKIGNSAFQGCIKLNKIYIPASVTNIGEAAFAQCQLSTIDVSEDNTRYIVNKNQGCLIDTVDSKLVQGGLSADTAVPLDGSIHKLGEYCFANTNIVSATIPDTISIIPNNAFSTCKSLISVTLPNILKKLDATCFAWCNNLSEITLPNELEEISTYAFNSCSLVDVVIPASVNSIQDQSFGNIYSLRSVIFNRAEIENVVKVPNIHYNAFSKSGCPLTFTIPWTIEQHRTRFTGTYTDWTGATRDRDVFFGASKGSILKFVDEAGNTIAEIEKTVEGEQSDVYV